jgi:hypothetical protein
VWTKDFKSSPPEEDDVEEDDVEMTGEGSGDVSRVDEDPFEKELRLANETSAEQHRVSTAPTYCQTKGAHQLEEWMKEKPIPYMSNDKFSQEGIFSIGLGVCQGTLMSTRRTLTSLGCGDSSMVALHLEAG